MYIHKQASNPQKVGLFLRFPLARKDKTLGNYSNYLHGLYGGYLIDRSVIGARDIGDRICCRQAGFEFDSSIVSNLLIPKMWDKRSNSDLPKKTSYYSLQFLIGLVTI
jgi:hypothetical protein